PERAEDLEERVLDQVLEVPVRAEDPEQRMMHRVAGGLEQRSLGRPIAFSGAAGEGQVMFPGRDGGGLHAASSGWDYELCRNNTRAQRRRPRPPPPPALGSRTPGRWGCRAWCRWMCSAGSRG